MTKLFTSLIGAATAALLLATPTEASRMTNLFSRNEEDDGLIELDVKHHS